MEKKKNVTYNPEPTYVYEAHIPYLLQFLTDYNLFGCGWVNIDKDFVSQEDAKTRGLYFRSPILQIYINHFIVPTICLHYVSVYQIILLRIMYYIMGSLIMGTRVLLIESVNPLLRWILPQIV